MDPRSTFIKPGPSVPDQTPGWIILAFALAAVIVVLIIILAIVTLNNNSTPTPSTACFGEYGVESNVDANPLNRCGSSRSEPCIFTKTSLNACISECDQLSSFCSAFTFNPLTSTMKIVPTTGTFTSTGTNLFVRQNCPIS